MKLKKASESEQPTELAPVMDNIGLEPVPAPAKGGVGATIAFLCGLLSIAMLGVVAWLLYMNWELIQDV